RIWSAVCLSLWAEDDQNRVTMKFRSFLKGLLWTLVALLFVFHVGAGWYFSDVLIADAFVPEPDTIELPESAGDLGLEEVTYESDLGEFDAWYIPASGDVWVIHVHGKGATPAEAEPLFQPLKDAGYPQLSITYRNDAGQPLDPSGHYRYGVTEWDEVYGVGGESRGRDDASATGGALILRQLPGMVPAAVWWQVDGAGSLVGGPTGGAIAALRARPVGLRPQRVALACVCHLIGLLRSAVT